MVAKHISVPLYLNFKMTCCTNPKHRDRSGLGNNAEQAMLSTPNNICHQQVMYYQNDAISLGLEFRILLLSLIHLKVFIKPLGAPNTLPYLFGYKTQFPLSRTTTNN